MDFTDRLRSAYEAIYLESTIEMDPFRIEAEDLLLNLALSVEAAMRARGTPLPTASIAAISSTRCGCAIRLKPMTSSTVLAATSWSRRSRAGSISM